MVAHHRLLWYYLFDGLHRGRVRHSQDSSCWVVGGVGRRHHQTDYLGRTRCRRAAALFIRLLSAFLVALIPPALALSQE
jgi:hypothetical protein